MDKPKRRVGVAFATLAVIVASAACSDDETSPNNPSTTASTTCQATGSIELALYGDDKCSGTPLLTYKLDIAQSCSGWTRPTGTTTKDNSASRFACYRDRLCYTQYVDVIDCSGGAKTEAKEARTDCIKDPTPNIWIKILSGTESCPVAPEGFACPSGEGSKELAAACK